MAGGEFCVVQLCGIVGSEAHSYALVEVRLAEKWVVFPPQSQSQELSATALGQGVSGCGHALGE